MGLSAAILPWNLEGAHMTRPIDGPWCWVRISSKLLAVSCWWWEAWQRHELWCLHRAWFFWWPHHCDRLVAFMIVSRSAGSWKRCSDAMYGNNQLNLHPVDFCCGTYRVATDREAASGEGYVNVWQLGRTMSFGIPSWWWATLGTPASESLFRWFAATGARLMRSAASKSPWPWRTQSAGLPRTQ